MILQIAQPHAWAGVWAHFRAIGQRLKSEFFCGWLKSASLWMLGRIWEHTCELSASMGNPVKQIRQYATLLFF